MEFIDLFASLLSILIFALVAIKCVRSFKLKHPQTKTKDVITFNLIYFWFAVDKVIGTVTFFVTYYINTNTYGAIYEEGVISSQICWILVKLAFAILIYIYAKKLLDFEKHNSQKLFNYSSALAACVVLYQLYFIYNFVTNDAYLEYISDHLIEWLFIYRGVLFIVNTLLALYLVIKFVPFRNHFYQMYSGMEKQAESVNIEPNGNTFGKTDGKLTKRCPYCGEIILEVAKKCKYCNEWLDK